MVIDEMVIFYEKTDHHKLSFKKENRAVFSHSEIGYYKRRFKAIEDRAMLANAFMVERGVMAGKLSGSTWTPPRIGPSRSAG